MAFLKPHFLPHPGLFKDISWASGATVFGRSFGFFIPIFIARIFGISREVDVFFFSYGLVFFMAVLFGDAVRSIFPSFLAEHLFEDHECFSFINSQTIVIGFAVILVHGLGIFMVIPWFQHIANFSSHEVEEVRWLYSVGILFVLFYVVGKLFSSFLDLKKTFVIPAISVGIRSVTVLITLLLMNPESSLRIVMLSYVLGEFISMSFVIGYVFVKYDFRWEVDLKGSWTLFRSFIDIAGFQVGAMAILSANAIVDQVIVSYFGKGGISSLEFSRVFYNALFPLLVGGPSLVLASYLANSLKFVRGQGKITTTLNVWFLNKLVFLCGLIIACCMFIIKDLIVAIMFGNKTIPVFYLEDIKFMVGIFCWTIPFIMSFTVASRFFQVIRKTKLLFLVAVGQFVINLFLDVLFSEMWGLRGIVISTLSTMAAGAIILSGFLYKYQILHAESQSLGQ